MAEVEQGNITESFETLTVDDICKVLQTSRSTVQRLIRRGEIQALPVNAPQDNQHRTCKIGPSHKCGEMSEQTTNYKINENTKTGLQGKE